MTTYQAFILDTPMSGDASFQTIVVPAYGVNDCFTREYTGSRGRGAAWLPCMIDNLTDSASTDTRSASFAISDKDLAALRAGIITTTGTKALLALNLNPIHTDNTHRDSAKAIVEYSSPIIQLSGDTVVTETAPITTHAPITVNEPAPAMAASSASMELATVPPIKWAEQYINRKVLGDLSEFDIYDQAMTDSANVLIKGHAGSGKTMSVMAYAAARGLRYYSVSSHSGVEPSQLFGKWNPTADGHFRWQDGAVTDLVRNGNGVLLLNEVNFMPERFTTVIFSLLDSRREIQLMDKDGEVVRAGENLLIVADMNPNYRGTRQMNQAWNDRFSQHMLNFPYDPTIEAKLIPNKPLLEMANQLRARFDKEELTTPISTRALVAFNNNIKTLGLDYAVYSYLNMFAEGERSAVALTIETHKMNIESAIQELSGK